MPSVYEYTDYRQYLADEMRERRGRNPSLSVRAFASKVGMNAGNLTRILSGKRNLGVRRIPKLAAALGLRAREGEYFALLVRFAQATDPAQRGELCEQLSRSRAVQARMREVPPSSYEYFGTWYNVVLRELIACGSAQKATVEDLAKLLDPPIAARQARRAVRLLEKLGLVERDSSGCLSQTDAFVTTADAWQNQAVNAFQAAAAELGRQALDRFPRSERDMSTLTVGLSDESLSAVKSILAQAREKILALAANDRKPDRVHQLNLHFFPVTRSSTRRKP